MEKKKKSLSWKGRGRTPFTISVSRFTLLEKKNETTLLEADVDTVSVIEDGKSSLSCCSYKGVLMAVKVPVMAHLPSWGRTEEAAWNPKWSQPVISTCRKHQGLSLFGVFFFPEECIIYIFHIILRMERQVKIKHLKNTTIWGIL